LRGRPPVPAPRTGRPLRRRQEIAAGISTQPRSARSGQQPPDGADHDQSKSTRQQGVLKQSHASAGLAAEGSSGHALQAVGRWEPSQRSADGRNDSRFLSAARPARRFRNTTKEPRAEGRRENDDDADADAAATTSAPTRHQQKTDTTGTGATTREGCGNLVGRGRVAGRSPPRRRETAPARAGSSRGNIDAGPKRPFWNCHPDGAGHGQKTEHAGRRGRAAA
jgi:hypothetical protein